MKLSIWQQFSSNHSAGFVSVGQFESADMATLVAGELRQILDTIGWWRTYITDDDILSQKLPKLISTNETVPNLFKLPEFLAFAYAQKSDNTIICEAWYEQQYQISAWNKPVDWIDHIGASKSIEYYHDLVIVEPHGMTWAGSHPIHALLEYFGGKVASSLEGETYIGFNLKCDAGNPENARDVVDNILSTKEQRRFLTIDNARVTLRPNASIKAIGKMIILEHVQALFNDLTSKKQRSYVPLSEAMQKIITFLNKYHCTHIEYSFMRLVGDEV